MSYSFVNKTMQANIHRNMSSTINKLELIIREHKQLSIHQSTYTLCEPSKHAHMNEYMYKNEKQIEFITSLLPNSNCHRSSLLPFHLCA